MTDKQRVNLIRRARTELKQADGFNPKGVHYRFVLDALTTLEKDLLPKPKTKQRIDLGPIVPRSHSILLDDCTHLTDELGWPAFDTMGTPGTPVLAPEDCVVDDNTSGAQGGDAFYILGASGLRYWVGHIGRVPALHARFAKGAVMTTISPDHPRPHVHLGIDARKVLGHHLLSHTDYTHGAPLIGTQLRAV